MGEQRFPFTTQNLVGERQTSIGLTLEEIRDGADYLTNIRLGNIAGTALVLVQGHAPQIGTSFATVAPFGTPQVIDVITSAALVGVASTDANDTSTGTGARTVLLSGLSSAGVAQTETITMNGQTKVSSANTYTAIHSVTVLTAGSGNENAGIIYVGLDADTFTAGVPTTLLHAVEAGWNVSHTAFYKVPVGKTAYLVNSTYSFGDSKSGTIRSLVRADGGIWKVLFELAGADSTYQPQLDGAPALPASAEIRLDGKVGGGTGPLTFSALMVVVDN